LKKSGWNFGVSYLINLGTRTEGNAEVWQFLEKICSSNEFNDDEVLLGCLEAMEIKPYQDCINICYDNAGAIYEIPNYCINEPCEYNIVTTKTFSKKVAEKNISVRIRKFADDIVVKCKNAWTVLELKGNIKAIGDISITNPERVRLFFCGKELQNSEELWFYNIEDESIIQILYNQG
jgi:hypothetical protein